MTAPDRSRDGYLVHSATVVPARPYVDIVTHIDQYGMPFETRVYCGSEERAAEIARVLSEARWPK